MLFVKEYILGLVTLALFSVASFQLFRRDVAPYMAIAAVTLAMLAKTWWDNRREVQFSLLQLMIAFLTFQVAVAAILNPWRNERVTLIGTTLCAICVVYIQRWQQRKVMVREIQKRHAQSLRNGEEQGKDADDS